MKMNSIKSAFSIGLTTAVSARGLLLLLPWGASIVIPHQKSVHWPSSI